MNKPETTNLIQAMKHVATQKKKKAIEDRSITHVWKGEPWEITLCEEILLFLLLLSHFTYAFFRRRVFLFYLWILLDIW
jgi:hypothetical protein